MYEYIIVTNPDRSEGLKKFFLTHVQTQPGFEDKRIYALPKGLEVQTLEQAHERASNHVFRRKCHASAFGFLLDNGDMFFYRITSLPPKLSKDIKDAHDPIVSSPVKKG
jgi:hypothetical protein